MTKYEVMREVKRLKAIIKKKCIECCCHNPREARLCTATDCPLFGVKG